MGLSEIMSVKASMFEPIANRTYFHYFPHSEKINSKHNSHLKYFVIYLKYLHTMPKKIIVLHPGVSTD